MLAEIIERVMLARPGPGDVLVFEVTGMVDEDTMAEIGAAMPDGVKVMVLDATLRLRGKGSHGTFPAVGLFVPGDGWPMPPIGQPVWTWWDSPDTLTVVADGETVDG